MNRTIAVLSATVAALAAAVVALVVVVLVDHRVIGGHAESPKVEPTNSPRVLQSAALETDIATQYQQRFTQAVQVDCPDNEPASAGVSFTCSISGSSQKIEVSVKDRDGNYTWRVTG